MIVICKRETKRLVKGVRYEVQNLWNGGTNQRWLEGKVEIKGIGRFVVNNFTDINGNDLPKTNLINPAPQRSVNTLNFEEIKEGDILICLSDSYKTLIKNGMYKVESKESIDKVYGSWRGSDNYLKLSGVNRRLKFSPWRFRALNPEESREISLKSLLDNEDPDIITSTKFRKIDMVVDKEKELIKILSKSILDENKHHLSILQWACRKSGGYMGVNEDDYKSILDLKVSDIIKILENE
jgi:hypothetical protein